MAWPLTSEARSRVHRPAVLGGPALGGAWGWASLPWALLPGRGPAGRAGGPSELQDKHIPDAQLRAALAAPHRSSASAGHRRGQCRKFRCG